MTQADEGAVTALTTLRKILLNVHLDIRSVTAHPSINTV
jgi:hypothetical protein